jgi:hypothetical protein
MNLKHCPDVELPEELLDAIRSLPLKREVEHCGQRFVVSPFDIYVPEVWLPAENPFLFRSHRG